MKKLILIGLLAILAACAPTRYRWACKDYTFMADSIGDLLLQCDSVGKVPISGITEP